MKAFPVVRTRLFLLLWRDLCLISCTALASSVQLGADGLSSVGTCRGLMGVSRSFTIRACSYSFLQPGLMWGEAAQKCVATKKFICVCISVTPVSTLCSSPRGLFSEKYSSLCSEQVAPCKKVTVMETLTCRFWNENFPSSSLPCVG